MLNYIKSTWNNNLYFENNNIWNNVCESRNKVIKNFFKIWILKELIYDDRFEKYYCTFLSEKGEFSEQILKTKLSEIYDYISNNDVTIDRPNNISNFSDAKIRHILQATWEDYDYWWAFSNDLATQMSFWTFDMKKEWIIEYTQEREQQMQMIMDWLWLHLRKLYDKWIYNIKTHDLRKDIITKIIEIIKNN